MELDFTTQLQPALWGLWFALVVSASGLMVAADRDQIELFGRYRDQRDRWRHRLELARKLRDRLLARTLNLLPRTIQVRLRNSGV
jgi:hypothetical protein